MTALIADPLGPGRTSLRRGAPGLAVAAAVAFMLIPLPLFVIVVVGDAMRGELSGNQVTGALMVLLIGLFAVAVMTAVLGGLIWALLRALGRESGLYYAAVGALTGLANGIFRGGGLVAIVLCIPIGAVIALTFWLVAREPKESLA